jgi:beta-glucanase (GH16 family)
MRVLAALAMVVCAAGLAACGGDDRPKTQVETFREHDPQAWSVSTHPLGRGRFEARNVHFGDTGLTLDMPQGELNGGEVQSTTLIGDGTTTARVRAAANQGSVSAFFLYVHDAATDTSDELDFEILAVPVDQHPRLLVTVWRIGSKTPVDQRSVPLDFDPARALHDYTIERDGGTAVFRIDGRQVFRSTEAPTQPLRPIFNAWYPTWQDPTQPPAGGQMTVDRFAFTPASASSRR